MSSLNRSKIFTFDERPSDSPFVERIWRTHSEYAGSFISLAMSHWEMVVTRQHGKTTLTLRGPETKATPLHCSADGEWLGIRFKLSTLIPHLPASNLVDGALNLPNATSQSFWLQGSAWQFPDFENADTFGDRSQQAPLAALLSEHFSVFNYDRRGHGESGFTPPYAVEREIEDLDAIIDATGGEAFVYGTSGCAVLALYAAAAGLARKIKKLALWEPSFVVDDSRPRVPQDYAAQLTALLATGQRGDMVELFMTKAVGMPSELVAQMRQAPWWPAQEALAHTLIYDAILMGDFSFPKERVAAVTVPTLVIDGGEAPWLSHTAQAVADALGNAQRRTISGQPHNVAPEAIAPVLQEFFAG